MQCQFLHLPMDRGWHPVSAPAIVTAARQKPILAGALVCALVSTAHAEYTLATATHVNEWVALAVPGALDLYVIQALRVRRDVAAAVLVMVAANITSHLLVAGLIPAGVQWTVGITAAVGAIAPGIVWRVHSLEYARTRKEILWDVEPGVVDTPVPATSTPPSTPVLATDTQRVHPPVTSNDDEYAVPDTVPGDWMDDEYPETYPAGRGPVPRLKPVPDLPGEYTPSTGVLVPSAAVLASDTPYLPHFLAYLKTCVETSTEPSVRGTMRDLGVGQPRAERLIRHMNETWEARNR